MGRKINYYFCNTLEEIWEIYGGNEKFKNFYLNCGDDAVKVLEGFDVL